MSRTFPLGNFRPGREGNPIIAGIHREMARRGAIKDSLMFSKMVALKGDLVPSNSGRWGIPSLSRTQGGPYGSFNCGNPNLTGKLLKPLNNLGNPYVHPTAVAPQPHKLKLRHRIRSAGVWIKLFGIRNVLSIPIYYNSYLIINKQIHFTKETLKFFENGCLS